MNLVQALHTLSAYLLSQNGRDEAFSFVFCHTVPEIKLPSIASFMCLYQLSVVSIITTTKILQIGCIPVLYDKVLLQSMPDCVQS